MNANSFFNAATVTLSIALLAATASPAHADSGAIAAIERGIDATLTLPANKPQTGIATVAVRLDVAGAVESAMVVGSAGNAAFDREAVRTATAVPYPVGSPRNVVMVLGFGREVTAADRARGTDLAMRYITDRRQLLAGQTGARPLG